MEKKIVTISKYHFFRLVAKNYGKYETEFLIALRDSLSHVILNRLKGRDDDYHDERIKGDFHFTNKRGLNNGKE